MAANVKRKGTRDRVLGGALGFLCLMGIVAALDPGLRAGLRAAVLTDDGRSVLSTAQGRLLGDASVFTVAKIKTREALYLEIYETLSEGQSKFVEKIELTDARDGYFDFNGRATNLAIADLDGDGRPEILAPSFDDDLIGRLNVFKYDPTSRGFQRTVR